MRDRPRASGWWARAVGTLAVVCALAGLFSVPTTVGAAENDESPGLRVVGRLVRPADRLNRPMGVDEKQAVGFVTTHALNARLHMFDLERLVPLGSAPEPPMHGYTPESALALDSTRQRLYATQGYPGTLTAPFGTSCNQPNPNIPARPPMRVYDYRQQPDGTRTIRQDFIAPMPCTGPVQFYGLVSTYDDEHDLVYAGGVPATEAYREAPSNLAFLPSLLGGTSADDRGQTLLLRQMRVVNDGLRDADPGAPRSQLVLEWELDLRLAGCGRRNHMGGPLFEGFVTRIGDDVFAYCWDSRFYRGIGGEQGYLVRIPLEHDPAAGVTRPKTRGGEQPAFDPLTGTMTNYAFRRMPTLPGDITPIVDHLSGRIMFVTTGPTNGNAVWVFDARAGRFVGVITGGYADEQPGNSAVGFDSRRGRVYVLTQNGLLIAPIRLDPLPAGLIYPILVNEERVPHFVTSDRIAVVPELGRLFVAMNDFNGDGDDHYEVLEDHIPDPPRAVPLDPDELTTQVKEEPGATQSSSSGQAIASGAHVVNAGGLPRVVGQNDPTCVFGPPSLELPPPGEVRQPIPDWQIAPALVGSCLGDLLLSGGHRDLDLAAGTLEASTGGGATARAAALGAGAGDTGTDADVRRFSDCASSAPDDVDRWGRRWPFPPGATVDGDQGSTADPLLNAGRPYEEPYNDGRDQFWNSWKGPREENQAKYREGCHDFQDETAQRSGASPVGSVDLRSGVKGPDGKGFPVRAAVCGDFGGSPSGDTWPEQSAGAPQAAYPTSSVRCDASGPTADGQASAGALVLPSTADPQLSVARAWSKVSTLRTAEGQVTVAVAAASGVQIPAAQFAIAEVRSLAVTKARGRTTTASATLVRQWCGVTVAGQTQPGCMDPDTPEVRQLLDRLNATLLEKIQLSVPDESEAPSPGGFQAVVTKHPGQRGADQTVNDDDGHTVSALQVLMYNDGRLGRSRLIAQLAGVHAESRYGIVELPVRSPPGHVDPPSTTPPAPPAELPPSGGSPGETPAAPPTLPDTFTPESFVEERFVEEFRAFPSAPPQSLPRLPSGGNQAARVIEVPVRALSDAINLLVQNPREAGLLFVVFALLASPFYLGARRRSFARQLLA